MTSSTTYQDSGRHEATHRAELILIVDDEAQVRRLLSRVLEMDRYEVLSAADGGEALDIIRRETVSLVLADLIMPGVSGMDLLRELRAHHSRVPVIIISGKNDVEAAVECIRNGAADYISKPFKVTQIRQAVRTALRKTENLRRQEALSAMSRITPQESLAGYEVVDTLGEGTMGTVLLAEQVVDGVRKKFAIKVLKVVSLDTRKQSIVAERFMREAKVLSRLNHPNIVRFVEYGLAYDDTVPYFVMDYLEGKSLRQFVRDDTELDREGKVRVLRDIASALDAIHAQHLCHRDIKPDNIIVTPDGQAVLTDFGVVRVPESELTLNSQFIGSPAYLSPEGYRYGQVDARSDIFSLGVVAYELLLGRKPFVGENISELSRRVLSANPVAPQRLQPDFPPALQGIIARMLRKAPEERFQSAGDLIAQLDAYLDSLSPEATVVDAPGIDLEDSDWR